MSTQVNVLNQSTSHAEPTTHSEISPVRLFFWSVRRELWDNRSLYLAPSIVAGLILVGFFFGPFGLRSLMVLGPSEVGYDSMRLDVPYHLASGIIMVTSLLVSVFYSVDTLYAERRDRSILFWKSLPVSDLTAVLAKASIPLLVIPLIAFVLSVTTHILMTLGSLVWVIKLGVPVAALWSHLALGRMWLLLFGHLFSVAALWYAPFYAWFFFVSAWATQAPLLWAFLPPLAVSVLEAIIFHSSYIGSALKEQLSRGNMQVGNATNRSASFNPGLDHPAMTALHTPQLWLGLLIAVVLFTLAVQLRRYKSTL